MKHVFKIPCEIAHTRCLKNADFGDSVKPKKTKLNLKKKDKSEKKIYIYQKFGDYVQPFKNVFGSGLQ